MTSVLLLDLKILSECLVAIRPNLNAYLSLGNRRDADHSLLIRARLPSSPDLFAQLHHGAALHEPHDDAGTLDGLPAERFDLNSQVHHRWVRKDRQMDDQHRGKYDPNCSHTRIMTELSGSRVKSDPGSGTAWGGRRLW
jgi:hypothetical protein